MVASLRRFIENEVAQQRLKIIEFHEKYGEEAIKVAFGVDRKLISKWRKRLKENGGRLEALMPFSTRPKTVRRSKIPQKIIDFIRDLRQKYLIFYNTKRVHKSLKQKTPIQFIIKKGEISQMYLSYPSF